MKHGGSVYRYIFYGIIWIICFKGYECCRFGPELNCGFECRCTGSNICDSETGDCASGLECKTVLPNGYGWNGPGCRIGNVALGKSNVRQSGKYSYYSANLAIDGDTSPYVTNEPGESCAHPSTTEPYAWWWIDLGDIFNIKSITIVNRLTSPGAADRNALFRNRSTDFDLKIGNTSSLAQQTLCFHQDKQGENIQPIEEITCNVGDMVGQYVSFTRTGGQNPNEATICEFIVMGHKVIDCPKVDCIGRCDAVIGCENCVAGKKLPDCKDACPVGFWGINCANPCGMCKVGMSCNGVNGHCGEQCEGWYIPVTCTEILSRPPTTSNPMLAHITSDSAVLSWNTSHDFDANIQQYFYYIVNYRNTNLSPNNTSASNGIPLTPNGQSYQYNLSDLSYNTEYEVQIVPYRELNGQTESGAIQKIEFKTMCIAPETPPTPIVSGTFDMFVITWNPLASINIGCDTLESVDVIILCQNATHTTLNETFDVPITNTTFAYNATDSTHCEIVLVITNNEGFSKTSAATTIMTTTTTKKTTSKSATTTVPTTGPAMIIITDPPPGTSNVPLIAGAAAGGGVVLLAVIIIIPVVIMKRRQKKQPDSTKDEQPKYDEIPTISRTFNNNIISEAETKPKRTEKQKEIQYKNVDDRAMGGEYEEVGNITSSNNGAVATKASSEDKSHSEPPRPERLPPKPKPQQKPKPQVAPKVEPKFKLEDTDTKVLLTSLENYIKKKKKERTAFKNEYDALPTDHKHPCNTGIAKGNVEKNRFKNIVAYDHSRVILDTIDGDPLSDYVNANYLPGHSGDETYIASQGPKPEHVKDFWRMIWLKDINRIVMVTNEVEGNKKKCDRYWPLHVDNKLEHGDITILSLATEVYADFTIRVMKLTKQNESRQVRQFHFTSWHDKRIPDYAFPLLIFRHKIRSYDASARGPMLVHCSAGIGRTGTFIAIDYLMDQARKYDAIDVFSYVNKMRANRVNMIQTLEQYIFVYDTILESQMVGETAIPCSEMDARYPELIETGEYQNISQLEKEYKELQKFHPEPEGKQFSALSSANSNKNRNKNIYPSDVTRPFLVKHPGEDSDYINAVYIDGYTKNKAFIVTQLPLENTVIDFWRMITDHNSTTVIVLEPQTVPFIPTKVKSPEQHGNVEVTLLSEKTIKNVKIQDLSVRTPYGTGEPMLVTIYHTLSWTDKDFPKLNEILQLLQLLEKRQRDMHESPCTIQCLNGVSRSGVLISILYAIDRMRVDQEIDIFHSVKSVRINRNQFVESLAQYEYIYKSVQSYRAQFDTYANFD